MESLITKMNELYQKEKQNKIENNSSPNMKDKKNLIEKIYIIDSNEIIDEGKMKKLNNNNNIPTFQNEKELMSYIDKNDIAIKYINKIIKEIFKYKNNNTIIKFIEKNRNKLTEKNVLLILKNINQLSLKKIDDVIKSIFNNILIDENYFLELLKEEKIDLSKGIIESMNKFLKNIDNVQNKKSLLELIKTLNLISLVKEIIPKDDFDKYEKNINDIYEKELNKRENKKDLCEDEFNKDFNNEFINSMKIINSNPNKAYYIQENITI
jgi:hypothetical protein